MFSFRLTATSVFIKEASPLLGRHRVELSNENELVGPDKKYNAQIVRKVSSPPYPTCANKPYLPYISAIHNMDFFPRRYCSSKNHCCTTGCRSIYLDSPSNSSLTLC